MDLPINPVERFLEVADVAALLNAERMRSGTMRSKSGLPALPIVWIPGSCSVGW